MSSPPPMPGGVSVCDEACEAACDAACDPVCVVAVTRRVVIAGVSARGMAESAVRAGYTVVAVDAYADLDLAAIAGTRQVTPYTARAAAVAARRIMPGAPDGAAHHNSTARGAGSGDAICYVSNFENHPAALRHLARDRELWGNSPASIASARSPRGWGQALAAAGVSVPRIRTTAPRPGAADALTEWMLKPHRSGGGHGVQVWRPGVAVPRGYVLQERIAGTAGSIVFAADGRRAMPIAITRQLIGDQAFGAPPFRYCGNIMAPPSDPLWGDDTPLWREAVALAAAATRAFGLAGVNGIDFIVHRGHPVPIEINPRFTAAMELAERRDGISIFGAHVAGCTGALSRYSPLREQLRARSRARTHTTGAAGKAIVFARHALTVGGAVTRWLAGDGVRDIPRPGSAIPSGAPICSIFAEAPATAACRARLVRAARRIYETVASD
jgi:predicted ATP-grasp superfamily ATP-dependent carboligase